jgi:DNA-binding transcriptional regulator YhcF (GntR family)
VHIEIDERSTQPLSIQIAAGIRRALARKDLVEGDLLPSVRATTLELRVNPNVVREALLQLEKEGLVVYAGRTGEYTVTGPKDPNA